MELSSRQKSTIVVSVITVILIVVAITVAWYQNRKQHDLAVLSYAEQFSSSLSLVYSLSSHYPIEPTPVIVPSSEYETEKLCIQGFERFSTPCEKIVSYPIPRVDSETYRYQSDAKGTEFRFEIFLQTSHRLLGLQKGVVCVAPTGMTQGSCIQ